MSAFPKPLQRLVAAFQTLPGIGPKTAERLAFYAAFQSQEEVSELGHALLDSLKGLSSCIKCGGLSEHELCQICQDPRRDSKQLCLVENPKDIISLEACLEYRGLYFVLGSLLSPLRGIQPDSLPVEKLRKRVQEDGVREIIFALSPSVDGEATLLYLHEEFKDFPEIKLTRLATGLAVGSDLNYVDELTLGRALLRRVEI